MTFRLTRIRTRRDSDGDVVQDLQYFHDPVGNVVEIQDDATQTEYFANAVVEPHQQFTYDALYRLVSATGREHVSQGQPTSSELTPGSQPETSDPAAMRRYTETYAYDEVGNLLQVQHAATGGNWTRGYHYATDGNRLLASGLPGDTLGVPATYSATYAHDAHGNMTAMPHLAAIDWDALDRMQHADLGGGGDVYFQYDAAGNRVRKLRVNTADTQTEERIYLGTLELYRERTSGTLQLERETLHVADDTARVCMLETLTVTGGSPVTSPANDARYQYGNHLGTVSLELDEAANTINYEEYHPYGTRAYRAVDSSIAVSAKRYRYTGKERDEETGLDAMGARYYAAWLGRWTAADPIGLGDGVNRFAYTSDNPVGLCDPTGTKGEGQREILRADATDEEIRNFTVLIGTAEGDQRLKRDEGRSAVVDAVYDKFRPYAKSDGFSKFKVDLELRRLENNPDLGFKLRVGGPNGEGVTEIRLQAPIVTRLAKEFGVPLGETKRLFPELAPILDGAGTIDAPEGVRKAAEAASLAVTVAEFVLGGAAAFALYATLRKKAVQEGAEEVAEVGAKEAAEEVTENATAKGVESSTLFRGVPGPHTARGKLGQQGIVEPRGTALDEASLRKHVLGEDVDAGVTSWTSVRSQAKSFSGSDGTIIEVDYKDVIDRVIPRPEIERYAEELEILLRGRIIGRPTRP